MLERTAFARTSIGRACSEVLGDEVDEILDFGFSSVTPRSTFCVFFITIPIPRIIARFKRFAIVLGLMPSNKNVLS